MNKLRVIVDNEFNLEAFRGEFMDCKAEAHALMTLRQYVEQRLGELFPLIRDNKFDSLVDKLEAAAEVQSISPSTKQSSPV